MNRRDFIRHSAGSLTTATLVGGLGQLAAATASAQSDDYKALVCILLAGGADSFNMLAPYGNSEYNEYKTIRSDLALRQNTLLPLNGNAPGGKKLAHHAAMPELQALYNAGELAWVTNVGPLVEPTSTDALASGAAKLPLGLYSHSDQIAHWQTATPDARSATGWGGRMADLLDANNNNPNISMSISLSGTNLYQSGVSSQQYSVTPTGNGTSLVYGLSGEDISEDRAAAMQTIFNQPYRNILRQTYRNVFNRALAANQQFGDAIDAVPEFSVAFGSDEFSASMAMIAKTIAARQTLGMQRQSFIVVYGGWDHHDELINTQAAMLAPLSQGLASFHSAINELGIGNQVTTFTTSDFARTLSSNGRGSDHGWGGNAMVIGGAVKGGEIYGDYPSLALGNPLDTGRGVLMPTLSTDVYFAELARWFGIRDSELPLILPNLNRFYSPSSGTQPIGFMT